MTQWLANIINIIASVSVAIFIVLGKIAQSLLPDPEKMDYESQPEVDDIIHQWSGVWLSFKGLLNRSVRVGQQRVDTEEAIAARLHIIDMKALKYSVMASSIMRILICQRNQGDPDCNLVVKFININAEVSFDISAFFVSFFLIIKSISNNLLPMTTLNGV